MSAINEYIQHWYDESQDDVETYEYQTAMMLERLREALDGIATYVKPFAAYDGHWNQSMAQAVQSMAKRGLEGSGE